MARPIRCSGGSCSPARSRTASIRWSDRSRSSSSNGACTRRDAELTADELGALWLEVQTESLGPAFHFDESYRVYWSYIPHFIHVPFYVYAYAFGDCLVNSLYAVYQAAPDGFEARYLELLRAGGTRRHQELLAPFGLDATDPDFWAKGLAIIADMIDRLDAELAA